jgi:acyl carrier protein|tara:strand:- start:31 stop:261 length:231 start_codon:yes stop_codon:yes gene_type:complete
MNLRQILIETFINSSIPENIDNLKIGDLDEWDSLGNFNLILAIEQNFGIQFDFDQLENLNSIAEITKALENDISNK